MPRRYNKKKPTPPPPVASSTAKVSKRNRGTKAVIPRDPMLAFKQCTERSDPRMVAEPQLMAAISASSNTSGTKEVIMVATDYFDSSSDVAAPYGQWVLDLYQSPFVAGAALPQDVSTIRILSASLYTLPKFALDSVDSARLFVSSTPLMASGSPTNNSGSMGNTQSTLVMPSSVQKWVRVGHFVTDELLKDGQLQFITDGNGQVAVFSWVVLNPDNFAVLGASQQMKIEVEIAQTVPAVTKLQYGHTNSANAVALSGLIGGINASAKDIVVNVKGARNAI